MRQRKHALSGAIYDVRDDGNVDVTSRDGLTGTFTPSGAWIRGEMRQADPHLCGWLAGPQLPSRLAVLPRFRTTGSDTAGSGTTGDAAHEVST